MLHELVCDSSGQPIDYRILDCNPAFTAITGIPHQRACGAFATILYDSNEAPYLDIYARVVASGQSEHFETFYRPMNKHFSIAVFSIGPGRFATVTNDITEHLQSDSFIMADPTQIHQLLMNLCTNAEHAMLEQGGVLEVSLHDVEFHAHDLTRPAGLKPGHFVQLAVTDTGHGMDRVVLQRIFDPYFTTKTIRTVLDN